MTFSQANTSKKSWTSSKNHVKNAFSLKLADHNLTSIFNRRLHNCSCLTKLSYNCLQLQLGWVKFSRAERRKHKDSFAKMLTSLHRSVDFSRELCTPRPLKLASHVISHKPEVLDVSKICFIVIDRSL